MLTDKLIYLEDNATNDTIIINIDQISYINKNKNEVVMSSGDTIKLDQFGFNILLNKVLGKDLEDNLISS